MRKETRARIVAYDLCEAVGLIREKLGPPPASIGQMR